MGPVIIVTDCATTTMIDGVPFALNDSRVAAAFGALQQSEQSDDVPSLAPVSECYER